MKTSGLVLFLLVFIMSFSVTHAEWYDTDYPNRFVIDCSDITISHEPVLVNGSSGLYINGSQQLIWTYCEGVNTSVYFKSNADYLVANDTEALPFEVEKGDVSGYLPSSVWDSDYVLVNHMNDVNSTLIRDSTAYGNNGTKAAANEPNQVDGAIGYGQDFDGSDDNILCGNASELNFERTDVFTMEAFVKDGNGGVIIGRVDSDAKGYEWYDNSGSVRMQVVYNTGSRILVDSDSIPISGWMRVIMSYDGTSSADGVHFYLNGTASSNSVVADTLANDIAGNNIFRLGSRVSGVYYNGLSDEIRISKINRTQEYANETFNNFNGVSGYGSIGSMETYEPPVTTTTTTTTTTTIPVIDDYIFRCSFDDTTTCEQGGNPVSLTSSNITYVTGKFGIAANFTANSSLLEYNRTGNLFMHEGTISVWIQDRKQDTDNHALFSLGGNILQKNSITLTSECAYGNCICSYYVNDNASNINAAVSSTDYDFNASAWHHVVLEWSESNITGSHHTLIYENGAENTAFNTEDALGVFDDPSNDYFHIGHAGYSGIIDFIGAIDELKIYNRTLSADEAFMLFNETVPTTTTTTTTSSTTTTIFSSGWCYQEATDEATECGGLSTGSYSYAGAGWFDVDRLYDGDWDTSGYATADGTFDVLDMNYSKPSGALSSSLWMTKDELGIRNLSLPSGCWNAYDDYILLEAKYQHIEPTFNLTWRCFDGASFINLTVSSSANGDNNASEEGIWWDIEEVTTTTITTTTAPVTTTIAPVDNLVPMSKSIIILVILLGAVTTVYAMLTSASNSKDFMNKMVWAVLIMVLAVSMCALLVA
jgi:hypothetical protein